MRYKLNTDVIEIDEEQEKQYKSWDTFSYRPLTVDRMIELKILVPVEEKKCCDCCDGECGHDSCCGKIPDNCLTDCPCHKDNPTTYKKERWCEHEGEHYKKTANGSSTPFGFCKFAPNLRDTEPSASWWEDDFDAGHNTQNISDPASDTEWVKQFIRKVEKEAVQKSRKDWLLEEIERLEGMKKNGTHEFEIGYRNCRRCNEPQILVDRTRHIIAQDQRSGGELVEVTETRIDQTHFPCRMNPSIDYNQALSDIQDHYQKELNQK